MRWCRGLPAIFMALSACSSGGPSRGPAPPIPWTAGRYSLEARIPTTEGGFEVFNADLTIREDGSMSLLSSSGQCRTPTLAELRRDEERRRRTFVCGDATYVLTPTADRVAGEVRARVTEQYREIVTCLLGQPPPCYVLSTRRVTRSADLRVYRLD